MTALICGTALLDACEHVLEPKPIDLLVNDVVLNEANDVPAVEIGLYNAFRGITPNVIIAGDFTADMLLHNGTFTQYRELGTKRILATNASVAALWGSVYATVYIANFMLERIPEIPGVTAAVRQRSIATARYLRGLSYFIAVTTFGRVPLVTTTSVESNQDIPRAEMAELMAFIEADLGAALGNLPTDPTSPALASEYAVRAALARFYLYNKSYAEAEAHATAVIASEEYELESDYLTIVEGDFTTEAIFEVGYTISDDPATLNTLFLGRREIIPSNDLMNALFSDESGDRFLSATFDITKLAGNDNGWSVNKYGTALEDNNNIVVFRLAEMYLIRAEARAHQSNFAGALEDLNVTRERANAVLVADASQSQLLNYIEDERRYEFAFEGHRWYDLVRTGRAEVVMPPFNSNWQSTYNLWPVPQRELQNNPSLADDQNPGY
jgi:hypothetical protein